MTKPMYKSRSWKRKKVRTPDNKLVTHYRKKKPSIARCARCKKPLHGVPRARVIEIKKLAKTKKKPERPFGGNLCSSCMREVIREKVRNIK